MHIIIHNCQFEDFIPKSVRFGNFNPFNPKQFWGYGNYSVLSWETKRYAINNGL